MWSILVEFIWYSRSHKDTDIAQVGGLVVCHYADRYRLSKWTTLYHGPYQITHQKDKYIDIQDLSCSNCSYYQLQKYIFNTRLNRKHVPLHIQAWLYLQAGMPEQPRQVIPADPYEKPSSPFRNFFLHLEHVSHREWRGTSFDRSG